MTAWDVGVIGKVLGRPVGTGLHPKRINRHKNIRAEETRSPDLAFIR